MYEPAFGEIELRRVTHRERLSENMTHASPNSLEQTSPPTVDAVLRGMLELAGELGELHRAGQIHRQVSVSSICVDWTIPRVSLDSAAVAAPMSFGGLLADPERCPPEMRRPQAFDVSGQIELARRELAANGVLTPPERIDIYQFGTLLCRLVTGRSVQAYLSSPGVVFRVPPGARRVIDACLGYDESQCVESAVQLQELIRTALGSGTDAVSAVDQPADTKSDLRSETRTHLRRPPFERLGHFEIQDEIGHGGMGTVYRAYDKSLDRTVAVKVLSHRLASDPTFVKRFQAEAAAAARLAHPNVVPIFFIGEDAGRHFYAMRFINGESLADRLHREPPMTLSEVLVILQQVLQGLAAAHRIGLVHRDIKPGNILIDRENGLAMLTDFGLARSTSMPQDQADQNVVMGTAEYMSPEQAQGEPADPRSDLYSVGVLLYQLIAGQMPFDGDSPSSHLIHHVCTEPRPLRELAPDVEPQLDAVVNRLLRKKPEARYPSVEELLIDLDAALDAVFAGSPDAIRPVAGIRAARSSRIRRMSSSARLAAVSELDRPADVQPSGTVRRLSPAVETTSSQAAAPRSRRTLVLTIAGMFVALIAIATARLQHPAAATTLQTHQDEVSALVFSPDGRWLLSGGGASSSLKLAGDTSLRLWNAHTGQLVKQSERLPVRPRQIVFLGDSRRAVAFASAREDAGTLLVWDSQTGSLGPTEFSDPFTIHFAAVPLSSGESNESVLAAGRSGLRRIGVRGVVAKMSPALTELDAVTVRAVAVSESTSPLRVFVSRESRGRDGEPGESIVAAHDLDSGRQLSEMNCGPGIINALVASANGRVVVIRATELPPRPNDDPAKADVALTAFDFVSVYDWPNPKERLRLGPFAAGVRALAITPDGRRALTIAEPSIGPRSDLPQDAVWLDLTSGQEICRLRTNGSHLTAVALSPNGRRAALADAQGRVVFCDLPE